MSRITEGLATLLVGLLYVIVGICGLFVLCKGAYDILVSPESPS